MPKKEETKDITVLSFFECREIIDKVTAIAAEHDGEVPDEQIDALIEAQTQAPAKLKSMCNFTKLLDNKIDLCKKTKEDINASQKHAEDINDRIKSRLARWVDSKGKSYHVGEYEMKSRLSTSVKLVDSFDNPMFCKRETLVVITPDKKAIKEALLAGEDVPGAELVESYNLTIK